MTDWNGVFLGVIAAATLVMALMQVGLIIVAAAAAKKAQQAVEQAQAALMTAQQTITSVHEEIRPLLAKANAIAEEASRTAALATAQAQKVDRVVTDLASRIDETSSLVQQAFVTPAREELAIMAAIKATLGALAPAPTGAGAPAVLKKRIRCSLVEGRARRNRSTWSAARRRIDPRRSPGRAGHRHRRSDRHQERDQREGDEIQRLRAEQDRAEQRAEDR